MTTVARTADELTEALGDTASLREIVKSPETLQNYILEYAKNQARSDDSIAQQVREETQKAFAEHLRTDQIENINRLNLTPDGQPAARSKHYNAKAPGAKLDKSFSDWTSYMTAVWDGAKTQEAFTARAELAKIQNSFGSTVPSDGGFLIPETLRSELLQVSLEQSLVRSRARVVPMETLMVPYPMVDTTSNASTVHGGILGYWTEEGGTLTDSSPTFGRIELQAKKLTLYSEIPNELFQDSLATLQQFMSQSYPEALAWFEDIAFIEGNGVGQPTGFLNAAAAVSVAKESGQSAATILWENIVKAYSRMLPASIGRAVWVAHIDTFPELATMALSVGTGGSAVWVGNGDGAGAPPMTILGRPVIFTEKVSTVGTVGDINFVDFGYYLIGDRQAMQMSTSTEYKFGNDKTAMRVIERVDGTPWIKSAITPRKGSNTLSPFVKVATRA
ncbi:phage major capsid protein [Streptomyces sp. NBC_01264]|uniref:phage major capsid protein n=1 Tax=Streptomyces sp. NBC_01264 TaxID=2903804 RepID=UPI00224D829B|nr:phage major capsid protein [Streptomyces sp. NBC_01264]MCX4778164.1 phage major capsid protein [Streptomyces sp. NBC_01264]